MDDIEQLARELSGAKTEAGLRSLLSRVAAVAGEPDSEARLEGLLSIVLDGEERIPLALAMWVVDPKGKGAANELVRHCSVRHLRADAPPAVDLRFLRPQEAAIAVRRMNRWIATPAYVLGWILEILRRWPEDQSAFEACDRVMFYLICEFPGPTHGLMSNLLVADLTPRAQELLSHYQNQLTEDEERLQSFPWLNEFALSGRESEVLRVHRQRTSDEIVKHAEEKSIFAKFASKFRFKYSHRVVLPSGDGETSLEMQEMSGEAPLPISEWSDPIEGIRRRDELWMENKQ